MISTAFCVIFEVTSPARTLLMDDSNAFDFLLSAIQTALRTNSQAERNWISMSITSRSMEVSLLRGNP